MAAEIVNLITRKRRTGDREPLKGPKVSGAFEGHAAGLPKLLAHDVMSDFMTRVQELRKRHGMVTYLRAKVEKHPLHKGLWRSEIGIYGEREMGRPETTPFIVLAAEHVKAGNGEDDQVQTRFTLKNGAGRSSRTDILSSDDYHKDIAPEVTKRLDTMGDNGTLPIVQSRHTSWSP